jgi:hypothetical protein
MQGSALIALLESCRVRESRGDAQKIGLLEKTQLNPRLLLRVGCTADIKTGYPTRSGPGRADMDYDIFSGR